MNYPDFTLSLKESNSLVGKTRKKRDSGGRLDKNPTNGEKLRVRQSNSGRIILIKVLIPHRKTYGRLRTKYKDPEQRHDNRDKNGLNTKIYV